MGRHGRRHFPAAGGLFLALLAAWPIAPAAAQERTANPHIATPTATPNLNGLPGPMLPYHFAPRPAPPPGAQFGNVSAVALTPQGHLLVLNRNPAIMMDEYDAGGAFLRSFNPNIAVNTHGMKVDRRGNIWVIDSFLNVVWKLNPRGEPLMMLGTRGEVGAWRDGAWNHMFNQPLDIAWDGADNFYIVQGHGGTSNPPSCTYCATYTTSAGAVPQGSDPRLLKFDAKGNLLASRPLAHPDGLYPTIHSVMVTAKGEVWVADRQANTILVFDRALQPVRTIKEPCLVSGLFLDARGQIWMSAGMDGMIATLDGDGRITGWIGKPGRTTDPRSDLIGEAHYLAVTPDRKTIYIADSVNAKVVKLVHN